MGRLHVPAWMGYLSLGFQIQLLGERVCVWDSRLRGSNSSLAGALVSETSQRTAVWGLVLESYYVNGFGVCGHLGSQRW